MALRVFVICSECHRQRELMIDGQSVVLDVSHDCDAQSAFKVQVSGEGSDAQLTIVAA